MGPRTSIAQGTSGQVLKRGLYSGLDRGLCLPFSFLALVMVGRPVRLRGEWDGATFIPELRDKVTERSDPWVVGEATPDSHSKESADRKADNPGSLIDSLRELSTCEA